MNELSMMLMSLMEIEDKSSTYYQIAKYILENAQDLEDVSIASLAKACHVSMSSISRFCKYIGLNDFTALKFLIYTYYPGKSVDQKYAFPQVSNNDLDNFLDEFSDCLSDLRKHVDEASLNELVEDIHRYNRVILMGNMQSFGVAVSLQGDLAAFNKFVVVCGQPHLQNQYLTTATDHDLIIIFSATAAFFRHALLKPKKMDRETLPRIYLITVNEHENESYLYKKIQLHHKYNYASNLLLNVYVAMISMKYKERISG